jgi:hypothetical protein
MIEDYEEIQKRIRPVFLHDEELKEAGAEDAVCELLRTLQLELNTLEYTQELDSFEKVSYLSESLYVRLNLSSSPLFYSKIFSTSGIYLYVE